MPKITLIGAGSVVFTRNLCSDILLTPALQNATIALMDIDAGRLAQARDLVQALIDGRKLDARVEATTDRRAALRGADYVVTTFQQGGLEAYKLDIDIPQRYGVEQCVGDTLGPGGVFGVALFALVIAAEIGLAASWIIGMIFALRGMARTAPFVGAWATRGLRATAESKPASESETAAELIERTTTSDA